MDGTTGRVRARRQTRTSTSIAGDEDEYAEPPVATVKRTTRRTSVITVEPKGENGHAENVSIHDEQQDEGAHEGHRRKSHLQAASEKVQATAGRVGSQIQETLSSAVDKAGLSWPTLGTLLLLTVLTSALTSRLLQPDLTKQKTSTLRSSMEQADQRYSSVMKKLQAAEDRLDAAESKVQRNFQQGSDDESSILSRKADPTTILNLAEQRMQSLLDKFAADKTGLVDYALAPAGGRVIAHTQLYPRPDDPATTTWSQIGAALIPGAMPAVHPKANKFVLTPGGPVPGECLPLNGSKGEVIIHLREPIVPTALTYEHVPSAITYDFRSAPSDITVVGWLSEGFRFSRKRGSWLPALEHRSGVEPKQIGSFTYDFSKGNLQTIAVDSSIIVDHIRFQVNKNYGQPDYTCIYRVRVHGIAASGYEHSAEEVASSAGSATSGSF